MVEASYIAEALVLIAAWLLPLAWLVSRKGWRLDERRREIKRLLLMASEEAVRTELEASAVAWVGPVEALVICAIWMLPLVAFLIQRNRQQSVERSHGIDRLQELTAEEASRAEAESSIGYTTLSPPYYHQCSVCYGRATIRCSRCQTIQYCSVQCEMTHWYEGHCQLCRPP